jgi:hypothetical protein
MTSDSDITNKQLEPKNLEVTRNRVVGYTQHTRYRQKPRISNLCFRNIDTRCPRERNFRATRHWPIHQSVRRPWKFELWGKTRLENCRAGKLYNVQTPCCRVKLCTLLHSLYRRRGFLLSILFDLSHSSLIVLLTSTALSRLSIGV